MGSQRDLFGPKKGVFSMLSASFVAVLAYSLIGCGGAGGAGGASGGGTVPDAPEARSEEGTALFDVDVANGSVKVTSLEAPSGRAVLAGGSVGFTTSTLLSEGGEVGRRSIKVQLKNNLTEAIGVGRPIRIQFGVMGPALGYSTDLRPLATVSSAIRDAVGGYADGPVASARIASPSAVANGFDGAIYFNGTDGRIRKLIDGNVSTVTTSVPASSLSYMRDPGTGREFLLAPCETLHSIKLVAIDTGLVTTFAGLDGVIGDVVGAPAAARFSGPTGSFVDSASNTIYITDTGNGSVKSIAYAYSASGTPGGSTVVSRFTGITDGRSVAVSANKNIAILEKSVHRIRIIVGGVKSIIFGGSPGNVVGSGELARFNNPTSIVPIGDVFIIGDSGNNQLKRIWAKNNSATTQTTATWQVASVAGQGGSGFVDGNGSTALFGSIAGITTDRTNKVLVADAGTNGIRRVVSEGSFDFGTPDGSGTGEANLVNPSGFADLNGLHRPYIDVAQRIEPGQTAEIGEWQFTIPSGVPAFRFAVTVEAPTSVYAPLEAVLNTVAGSGSPNVIGQYLSRANTGSAFTGRLDNVAFDGISTYFATDSQGVIYASDGAAKIIRRIDPDGTVTLIAGKVGSFGAADGNGSIARFGYPDAITVNPAGTEIIVADEANQTIRRVALFYEAANPKDPSNWSVTTIAGAAGVPGDANGTGDVARFRGPVGLCGPGNDSLYLTEFVGFRIRQLRYLGGPRELSTSWGVETISGSGVEGYLDGSAGNARYSYLVTVAYSPSGKVYIADRGNKRIRVLDTLTNVVSTLAGNGVETSLDNANALLASFSNPNAIATDAAGAVYVGDGALVRRILNGSVKTVAGGGAGNGTSGDKLSLTSVYGAVLNAQGDLLVNAGGRLLRLTRRVGR